MLVTIQVESDSTVLEIRQENLLPHMTSQKTFDANLVSAVVTMGECAGRMIAALVAGGETPIDVMIEEFQKKVIRSARSSISDTAHVCDGTGCR